MSSSSPYPAVIASERWRSTDLSELTAVTKVVYREQLGRVDFLLGPGRMVLVDRATSRSENDEGFHEALVKLHSKSGSSLRDVVVISAAPSIDLQLLCDRLNFRVIPSLNQPTPKLVVQLLKLFSSDSSKSYFPEITSS